MSDPHLDSRGGTRRILLCRRCGHETGIPGAVYCNECRPHRLSDALMTPADWQAEAEAEDEQGPYNGGVPVWKHP